MNLAYFHLLLNHFPIVGVIAGILILIAGSLLHNETVKKTALGVFVFTALMAIPAFLTGDPAEELVIKALGITEQMIEAHESAAAVALWSAVLLGIVSGITLIYKPLNTKLTKQLMISVWVIAFAVAGCMVWTGKTGGQIRHTEFKSPSPTTETLAPAETK